LGFLHACLEKNFFTLYSLQLLHTQIIDTTG
jgi:hypothetical protein